MVESLVLKVSLVLFFCNIYVFGEDWSSICHQKFESTCSQAGFSTTWNKKSVSKHLKQWIQSVSIAKQKYDLKDRLHGSKYVRWDQGGNKVLLTMIANAECKNDTTPRKPVGKVWKKLNSHSRDQFRDGFFYGSLDSIDGSFNGNEVVFVFPDMKTVLVGKFRNSYMVAARESKIIAERCNNGIKEISVAPVDENSPVFRYKRPDSWTMGYDYTLIDPYERRSTYIKKTRFTGDSVFAKRNIKKGELVSYYSGVVMKRFSGNLTMDEENEFRRNSIFLEGDHIINILKPYWSITAYRATRGHKHNHSFKYQNVAYGHCYHPRYGHILSVHAIRDIKKGEEMFTSYGYSKGGAPDWYADLHLEEMGFPLDD